MVEAAVDLKRADADVDVANSAERAMALRAAYEYPPALAMATPLRDVADAAAATRRRAARRMAWEVITAEVKYPRGSIDVMDWIR